MPIYEVVAPNGRTYEVEAPEGAAPDAVYAFVAQQHPESLEAPPSMLGQAWEATKAGGASLLEALGRPGELVAGTVAGALAPTRDLTRGVRAFVEPLSGGTQQESFGKILQEQNPEFAKAHPWLTAGAGFAADVVTDPLNLLGGAGMVRRGALAGAKAAGVPERIAKTALGLPIGEAFQSKVVPAVAQATRRVAAQTPLRALMADPELAQLVTEGGRTGRDLKRAAASERTALTQQPKGIIASIVKQYELTPPERELLSTAIADPTSAEAAQVAADPARLAAARGAFEKFFDTLRGAEMQAGVQQAERTLTELTPKVFSQMQRMTPQQQKALTTYFREGAANVDPALQKQTEALAKLITKQVPENTDLRTLDWEVDATSGELVPTVSTRLLDYVPQYRATDTADVGVALAARPTGRLSAANERSRTWAEAVAQGTPTDIAEIAVRRASDSARARSSAGFLMDVYRDFAQTAPAPGLRTLRESTLTQMPEPIREYFQGGVYLPNALANEIERVSVKLRSPEFTEGVVNRGLRVWKTWATALNLPGHQFVNFSGNAANMYAAGMGPDQIFKDYLSAGRTLLGQRTPSQWADYADEARNLNLLGEATGLAGELGPLDRLTPTAERLMTGSANPLNPDNPLYTALRNVNQRYVEDPAKLALYAWARRSGKSSDEAATIVKKYLFDYSELSDFEKQYLRNAIPFYTWTRKNVPLQLATALQNPTRLTNQTRLLDLFTQVAEADESNPFPDNEALPTYLQGPETFKLPGLTSEAGEGAVASSRLPVFDLNLLTTDPRQLRERLAFLLNPAIRIPLEQLLGRRLGSQIPLDTDRLVEPTPLQTLTGLGVQQTTEGPRTSPKARYWAEQAPLPLGALARTAATGMDEKSNLPWWTELPLRSFGMTPVPITETLLRRAEQTRRRTQE
jgi:hypothetical protein